MKGGGECNPVSCTSFNQIHVSRIVETAEFRNHFFFAIFTRHGLIFTRSNMTPCVAGK